MFDGVTNNNCSRLFETFQDFSPEFTNIPIPEFLKTGLAKIRAHFTTWQLKAIKSV